MNPLGKRALRAQLVARRSSLDASTRALLSLAIEERLFELPEFPRSGSIAVYVPLGAEVELKNLPEKLASRGMRCAYPRVPDTGRRLVFAASSSDRFVRGLRNALEPPPDAPEVRPEEIACVLVPGLAFSESGVRLGRGGGFYDATLAELPWALRIALAYDFQVLPRLPCEPHDVAMDVVVTENRTLRFSREDKERNKLTDGRYACDTTGLK